MTELFCSGIGHMLVHNNYGVLFVDHLQKHKKFILFSSEGVFYYDPDKVLTPSTLHEVQSIVRKANKNGHMVRPLGSGHSWNALGQSEDVYVSLFMYRGLVKLDKVKKYCQF